MKHDSSLTARLAAVLAAGLAAGLALAGTALAVQPASGTAASGTSASAAACIARNLYVVKGRLEGAAGNRYLTVKMTNVGDADCSAGIATRAVFRDFAGPLGVPSAVSSGSGLVTLAPGQTVRSVVHWTDPGPVPPGQCQQASATLVAFRVPSLHHTWRLPLTADVCTTVQYRPDTTPLKS